MSTLARVFIISALLACASGNSESTIDYAEAAQRDVWLRHPVYGDASFDTFTHATTNPVVRGAEPYEWPVNGSLFQDPVSGAWYLFVGHYRTGYRHDDTYPSRATVLRSTDQGAHWEDLGPVFPPEEHTFEGETSPQWNAPDVAVVYEDGRYHMAYDWSTRTSNWENAAAPGPDSNNGAGYAWAERPEGPYHRVSHPIATTRNQPMLEGKYRRLYASTILRREKDWIVLTLTDSGPYFGWAYLGMTAEAPEGPYTPAKLLLQPECDGFHPPLMEYHPAFVHDGFVYAPATSVALNRNFQILWRAPLEAAMEPEAWEIYQHGSLWHAEPVEHEHYGIWGQTFSGFVDGDGVFNVMYPSRDSKGMGTINTASRQWDAPFRERGFYVSGHEGPSFVRLKRGGAVRSLAFTLRLTGAVSIVWNAAGPVGPNQPRSGATLHPRMLTEFSALRLTPKAWMLETVSADAARAAHAQGDLDLSGPVEGSLLWTADGTATLTLQGQPLWTGPLPSSEAALGLLADKFSHAFVERFEVTGDNAPVTTVYLPAEALLGAAQRADDWEPREHTAFRYGFGVVSKNPEAWAKWNIEGRTATLWAPRGPGYGSADLYLDGTFQERVSFHAPDTEVSAPRITVTDLGNSPHAISLRNLDGAVPLDVLEVHH